jgi:hypothetical protein
LRKNASPERSRGLVRTGQVHFPLERKAELRLSEQELDLDLRDFAAGSHALHRA